MDPSSALPARTTRRPGHLDVHLASMAFPATAPIEQPIAASFSVEQIRTAVELQAGRHVKSKVVIDL